MYLPFPAVQASAGRPPLSLDLGEQWTNLDQAIRDIEHLARITWFPEHAARYDQWKLAYRLV